MDLNDLTKNTQSFIIDVRNQFANLKVSTQYDRNTVIRLIVVTNERLSDKNNRKDVVAAIIGFHVATFNDLSQQQLMVLIDSIEKNPNAHLYIKEIEAWIVVNRSLPGGAIPITYYTPATRKLLSARLAHKRAQYHPMYKNVAVCFDCGLPIVDGLGDLHEGFITRGQVQNSEFRDLVFSQFNCAHRHNVCPDGDHSHTPGTGGDETLMRFTEYMILWEGKDKIEEWLTSMAEVFPVVGEQALKRFQDMHKDIEKTIAERMSHNG